MKHSSLYHWTQKPSHKWQCKLQSLLLTVRNDLDKTWITEVCFQHPPYYHSSGKREQQEGKQPCIRKIQQNKSFSYRKTWRSIYYLLTFFYFLTVIFSANWDRNFQRSDKNSLSKIQLPLPRSVEFSGSVDKLHKWSQR